MDVHKSKLFREALSDRKSRQAIADAVQMSPDELAEKSPSVTVDGRRYKIVIGKQPPKSAKK